MTKPMPLVSLLLPLAAAPMAPAQIQPHTPAIPGFATGYYDGSNALTSLGIGGRTRFTFQIWYRGNTVPRPTVFTMLGVRPKQGLTASTVPQDVEIVLSSTAKGFSTLDTTFANNLGSDATVFLRRTVVNPPALTNHTDPDAPAFWIPGDQPFVFVQGPHFLWQTVVQTEATSRTTGYTCQSLAIALGGHRTSDPSCGGSLAASSTSSTYDLRLTGALPNVAGQLILGVNNQTLAGAVRLPVDLGLFGMTGCNLAVDPLVTLPLTTDAAGNALVSVPFATPAQSVFLHAQVAHVSNANAVGLATTNVAHSVLGNAGMLNYLYAYDVATVAAFGPYTTNRSGPVLLYR